MTSPQANRVEYVSQAIIRRKFNNSQYPELIAKGQLKAQYLRDALLKDPGNRRYPEPDGTHSQTIRYLDDNGQWLVEVHQYMQPDGTIGGSGKPDPKRLRLGNTVFIVER
ncbi:MAG: hypothetical protein COS88_06125 [Chloroflexi bacterium CG07_land_8_20_14_0_80_51_10]|nr:MAG: hypothetical protein COS88_06125 [Chloroflexi bacterium CG07_land_8_20_14_0_80_51_10]